MSVAVNGVSVGAAYDYDSQGRLTSYTPGVPSGYGSITYTWNNLGQKTSMTVPLGADNKAERTDYFYDNTGKMIGLDVSSATFTVAGCGVDPTTASQTEFYYDDNQNRVKMVTKTNNPATYDGTYYFVYDPTASIPAVVYEQGPTYRYLNVRNPDGSLVGRRRYDVDADYVDERIYHFDGLGSTVALSNASGTITDRYSYDAWGKVTHTSGSTDDNPYQYVGQLGYYTHYQEPSLGLLQLGVRYYDPALGRFTSRDPAKQGISHYVYVADAPDVLADPTGRIGLQPDAYFAWNYIHGKRDIDLDAAEWYRFWISYWNLGTVRKAIRDYQVEVKGHIRDKVRRECRKNPRRRNLVTQWRGDETHDFINVFLEPGWLTVAQHSFYRKAVCLIKADCCKRKFRFECVLDFRMYDYWYDSTGWGIGTGGFDIRSSCNEDFAGSGSFTPLL